MLAGCRILDVGPGPANQPARDVPERSRRHAQLAAIDRGRGRIDQAHVNAHDFPFGVFARVEAAQAPRKSVQPFLAGQQQMGPDAADQQRDAVFQRRGPLVVVEDLDLEVPPPGEFGIHRGDPFDGPQPPALSTDASDRNHRVAQLSCVARGQQQRDVAGVRLQIIQAHPCRSPRRPGSETAKASAKRCTALRSPSTRASTPSST